MPLEPDPIRAHITQARRTQILNAATAVFAEKGFHRTKIKDIAQCAGLATGTIYNYFTNKEDLLLGLLDRLNETEQRLPAFEQGLAMDDIRGFFGAYLKHRFSVIGENLDLFRAALPEILTNPKLRTRYYTTIIEPTTQLAEHFFQMLMDSGHFRTMDARLSVRAVAGSVMGLLLLYLLGDETIAERWNDLPDVLTTLLFEGLSPDEAPGSG